MSDLIRREDALDALRSSFDDSWDNIEALPTACPDLVIVETEMRQKIYYTLRHYRQVEVVDEYGSGYPLVDALTLDGRGIDMGEREIEHLTEEILYAITYKGNNNEPSV